MKTKSIWGKPPSRLYRLIKLAENTFQSNFTACIVGCSDGKFLLPFARKNHFVTGYEIDKSALYGATKDFPIYNKINPIPYNGQLALKTFPTEQKSFPGCIDKLKIEKLTNISAVQEIDFYKYPPSNRFDVIFTSCSFQYSINADKTLKEKTEILQNITNINGYLYIDYMMAIEEMDYIKFPTNKYFRGGEIKKYFDNDWKILFQRENKQASFESAHIEHPYHHYHKFGYILAQRIK